MLSSVSEESDIFACPNIRDIVGREDVIYYTQNIEIPHVHLSILPGFSSLSSKPEALGILQRHAQPFLENLSVPILGQQEGPVARVRRR